ncbi:MAG TPA: hypothetical protein VK797_06595 [Tepidisphaeraceae bacterium]|nr:hypothetical protein [Tepidisphaeraceae bacterium]
MTRILSDKQLKRLVKLIGKKAATRWIAKLSRRVSARSARTKCK